MEMIPCVAIIGSNLVFGLCLALTTVYLNSAQDENASLDLSFMLCLAGMCQQCQGWGELQHCSADCSLHCPCSPSVHMACGSWSPTLKIPH